MIQLDPMKTRFVECPLAQRDYGCRAEPDHETRGQPSMRDHQSRRADRPLSATCGPAGDRWLV